MPRAILSNRNKQQVSRKMFQFDYVIMSAAGCNRSVWDNNKSAIKQIGDKYARAVYMPSVVADIL